MCGRVVRIFRQVLIGFGPSLIYSPYHQNTCTAITLPPTDPTSRSIAIHSLLIEFSAIPHHQHSALSFVSHNNNNNNNSIAIESPLSPGKDVPTRMRRGGRGGEAGLWLVVCVVVSNPATVASSVQKLIELHVLILHLLGGSRHGMMMMGRRR